MPNFTLFGIARAALSFLKDILLGKGVTWRQSWRSNKMKTIVVFICIMATLTWPMLANRLYKLGRVHYEYKQEMIALGCVITEDQKAARLIQRAEEHVRLDSMDRAEPIEIPPADKATSEPVETMASDVELEMDIRSQLILDEFEKIEGGQ